jgi:hypothetical protein
MIEKMRALISSLFRSGGSSNAATSQETHRKLKDLLQPLSLSELLVAMFSAPFLIELWKTIVAAETHARPPPAARYAPLPSALIGRPLALATMGLGLELATAPMRSQALADHDETWYPSPEELEAADPRPWEDISEIGGDRGWREEERELLGRYEFSVKIGDILGRGDRLVAYFHRHAPTSICPEEDDTNAAENTGSDAMAATKVAGVQLVTEFTARGSPAPFVANASDAPPLTVHLEYPRLFSAQGYRPSPPGPKGVAAAAKEYGRRAAAAADGWMDGWMDFIPPGGTEPKGPWHANYIRFVRFSQGLAQAL